MRKKSFFKKTLALAMAVVVTASMFTACGGRKNRGTSNSGKVVEDAVITFGLASAWDTLNIYASSGGSFAGLVADKVYDRLVYVNESFEVEPRAAKSWEMEDPTTLVFHLDEKATWHDGTPVTAKDWVFTAKWVTSSEITLLSRGFGKYLDGCGANGVETSTDSCNVEARGDYDLVLHLNKSYSLDSFILSAAKNLYVLPSHLFEGKTDEEILNDKYWEAPIGSGPCVYESQIAGNEIVFKTFDKYQLGKPNFGKLVFKVIAQSNFANAIMAKEVDITYTHMPAEDAMAIDGTPGVVVKQQESPTFLQVMAMNNTNLSTNMRKAINLAIDKELILNQFYSGKGLLTETVILPMSKNYVKNDLKQNLEEAKKYYEAAIAAGEWEAGKKVVIGVNTDSREKQGAIIQQNLKEIGLECEISMYDSTTMWTYMMQCKIDACLMGFMPTTDPLSTVSIYDNRYPYIYCVQTDRFAQLIDKLQVEQDAAKRAELEKQIQELEYELVPSSFICAQYSFAVTSDRIQGADPFASDMINNATWKWYVTE